MSGRPGQDVLFTDVIAGKQALLFDLETDESDECWATRLGEREVHDLRQCSHYAAAPPAPSSPRCWCCAAWGLTVPGTVESQRSAAWSQTAPPAFTCAPCAGRSSTACARRHLREANAAGVTHAPNDYSRGITR